MWKTRAAAVVETVHPVRGPAVQSVYGTGTVEATIMLPIAARSTARLMALNADEGASVIKGQVLAQLEDEDLQHNLNELTAQAEFTASDYQRKEGLAAKGFETKASLDQARSARDAAAAAVARAQTEIGFMKLTAPADGLVIKRDGEIGQLIPANQPILWISCCAPLRISAEIDEEDIGDIKIDQPVLIRADAFPGKIFHGKVQSITPKGDPVTRSYRVRVGFTEDTPLQIGMTAETNIIISETKNALLLPNSAIGMGNKIWLVKGNNLIPQTIQTGAKGPEQTEIRQGVAEKDFVVLKPDEKFRAGQEVHSVLIPQGK